MLVVSGKHERNNDVQSLPEGGFSEIRTIIRSPGISAIRSAMASRSERVAFASKPLRSRSYAPRCYAGRP